jgi:hypothetical protein
MTEKPVLPVITMSTAIIMDDLLKIGDLNRSTDEDVQDLENPESDSLPLVLCTFKFRPLLVHPTLARISVTKIWRSAAAAFCCILAMSLYWPWARYMGEFYSFLAHPATLTMIYTAIFFVSYIPYLFLSFRTF